LRSNNTKILLAFFAGIVGFLITLPLLYGYLICPSGKQFLGITGLYPIEQFYYLSMGPSQALKGYFLFADKYSRIADENVLINPIGNIIGAISLATKASLPVSFGIFRILSAFFLIISFYYLAKHFIDSRITLWLSVFLYCFSSGFDSIFHLLSASGIDAVDDSIPEANMFISMSGEYYLATANALFVLVLASAYRLICNGSNMILCGSLLLLLGLVYVYALVPAVVIISIWALCQGYAEKKMRKNITTLLKLSLFCLPVAGYFLWLIFRFPSINEEGWFAFPNFLSLISSFGFGFLFVTGGFFIKNRADLTKESFLVTWSLITLFLIYLPQSILPIQIQMLIGLGAPLSILAATSLGKLGRLAREKLSIFNNRFFKVIALTFVFCLITLSGWTNLKFYVQQFQNIHKCELPFYIDSHVYEAMEWTGKNVSEHKVVIVSRKLSFIFASITSCNVYTGVNRFRKKTIEQNNTELSLDLFRINHLEEAKKGLRKTGADYLFLEKSLVGDDLSRLHNILKNSYEECFSNGEVSILRLK
jgi:hypothetical protein